MRWEECAPLQPTHESTWGHEPIEQTDQQHLKNFNNLGGNLKFKFPTFLAKNLKI